MAKATYFLLSSHWRWPKNKIPAKQTALFVVMKIIIFLHIWAALKFYLLVGRNISYFSVWVCLVLHSPEFRAVEDMLWANTYESPRFTLKQSQLKHSNCLTEYSTIHSLTERTNFLFISLWIQISHSHVRCVRVRTHRQLCKWSLQESF